LVLLSQLALLVALAWSAWGTSGTILQRQWVLPNWPYTVAATFFSAQFLVGIFIVLSVLRMIPATSGATGMNDLEHVRRLRQVASIMTFVSCVCSGYYLNLALANDAQKLISEDNWWTGEEEVRLQGRYWLWAVLAPMQWISYSRLYTRASAYELASIVVITSSMILLGLRSATERSSNHGQGKPFFIASCMCFALMFRKVSQLPLEPGCAQLARKYRRFAVILWLMYPALHLLRSFGIMTLWQEQVLGYTFLDVIAKGISLSLCFCGPVFQRFLSSLGNLQIQSAMIDWRVCVDEHWTVMQPSTEAARAMQNHWFGGEMAGSRFLDGVVATDQSRESLRSAAHMVDVDPHFSTRKVAALLRMSHGGQVQALVFVSRCVWGSRQLDIALLQSTESEPVLQAPSSSTRLPPNFAASIAAMAVAEAREEGSEKGTIKTGISSIGSAIPLFRTDGKTTVC